MEKKLLNSCEKLSKTNNVVRLYKELTKIFEEVGMFYELAWCYRILWDFTKQDRYLIFAGDIFTEYTNNLKEGLKTYDLFFQRTNPYFFLKYKYSLNKIGYQDSSPILDNTDYFSNTIKQLDRYNTIIFIMTYFYNYKMYDFILLSNNYLRKLKVDIFINKPRQDRKICYQSIQEMNKYFSSIISQTENNDLNKYALKLNPKNEQAYLNIIYNFADSHNFEQLQEYYNAYAKNCDADKLNTVPQILWKLSNIYKNKDLFFKAVKCQQLAVEYELAKGDIA